MTTTSAPYVGLDYFGEEDAGLFFGRDAERKRIIGNLRASRLTLLYAETGVGKSSLLRAGVSARLRQLAAHDAEGRGSARYVPVVFSAWQRDAKAHLIAALEDAARPLLRDEAEFALRRDTLEAAIEDVVAAVDATPLVILDQFEEHFNYEDEDDFDDELAECINRGDLRANFLISVREDAYSQIGPRFKARIANVYGNYLHLDFLDARAARDAVLEPVKAVNKLLPPDAPRFEVEPALVDAVLEQVRHGRVTLGNGEVPHRAVTGPARVETAYLQLVMKRLWDEENSAGSHRLRLETLERLGGANTIVRAHLDDVMAKLPEDQREAAAAAFRFLVTPEGRKIALSTEELREFSDAPAAPLGPALVQLERARILRRIPSPEHGGVARHELYHDVLAPAVLDWHRRHETHRAARELAAREKEETRRRRRRRLRLAVLVIGTAVVALITILGIVAWQQRSEARKQTSIATSRELAATSRGQLYTDPELSILLAQEALRRRRTDEAVGALREALLADRSLGVLSAGNGAAKGVDVSGDHERLLAYGDDGHVRVWRLNDRKPLLNVRASASAVNDARFSPDGRRILSAGRDGRIAIWDAENGRQVLTLRRRGHAVKRAEWAPDGQRVLAVTAQNITVWSGNSGRPLQTLRSPNGAIRTARWQPNAPARILTAGDDGVARLWDAHGTIVASLDTGSPLWDAVFDDRGTAVVMTPERGSARVWHPQTGRTHVLPSSAVAPDYLVAATFDHSGRHVATAAFGEQRVRIWNTRTGGVDAVLTGHAAYVTAIEFSPDDSTVATASNDRTARIWDARTGAQLSVLQGHDAPIAGLSFPTPGLIATAGSDGDVRLWRTGAKQLASLQLNGHVDNVSFSHDGRLVVAATYDSRDSGVEIRPWKAGAIERSVAIPDPHGLNTASMSPDGHLVVVAGAHFERPSAPARVLHVPDGRTVARLDAPGSGNGAVTAAFSPDGRLIVTAHRDGAARLWSSQSHRLLRRLGRSAAPAEKTALGDAQFSSDGRRVVTVGATGIARIFDTASGHPLQWFSANHGKSGQVELNAAALQPRGGQLATVGGDGLGLLWNLQTGESRQLPHDDAVNSVAFSPDGAVIATASWDGTVRLWSATAYPLGVFQRVQQGVMSVAFSRDGHRLVTADETGVVRVFECELCGSVNDVQRLARARVPRGLTQQERRDYVGGDDDG